MQPKEYFYIYNFNQANFYMQSGIKPFEVGIGKKGEPYIKFKNTIELQAAFTKWMNRL